MTLEDSRRCLAFPVFEIDGQDTGEGKDVAGTLPFAGDVAATAAAA